MASGYSWGSQPSSAFYYATQGRLESARTPTLACGNSGDVYTLKVGAITADEVAYAGGVYAVGNSSYYLYNGQYYWSMSPYGWYYFNSSSLRAGLFCVPSDGQLGAYYVGVTYVYGVRPVINLKSDVTFSGGNGTQSNPYVVA